MSARRHPVTLASLGLLLPLYVYCAQAQEREALFRAAPLPASSSTPVTAVVEPAGGQYMYSSERPAPRPSIRFAIGKAPQADYAIFSAEEQHELDLLREHAVEGQTGPAPLTSPGRAHASSRTIARVTRHAARVSSCQLALKTSQVTNLAWPKVMQQDQKVCVPKLEFAGLPDWRDHVWCFDKGDGSVR